MDWLLRILRLASLLVMAALLIAWLKGSFSADPFRSLDPQELAEISYMAAEGEEREILFRRGWSSSDVGTLGPWRIRVAAADFRVTRVNVSYMDDYSEINTDCALVVEYRGRPWDHMYTDVVNRIIRIDGSSGTHYVNRGADYEQWSGDNPSYFQYTLRSDPNRFVTWINMDRIPYDEEWLELSFDPGEGEPQRLRLFFSDWAPEEGAALTPLEDEAAAAEQLGAAPHWEEVFLAEPETLWTRSWRQAEPRAGDAPFAVSRASQRAFRDDVEAALEQIRENGYSHLLPYEARDCVRMCCVLIFPGDAAEQPLTGGMLYSRLSLSDPDAGPANPPIEWTVWQLPDYHTDAVLYALEWDCREDAARYVLRYTPPDGETYSLTLVPGEEERP